MRHATAVCCAGLLLAVSATASANRESEALRREAAHHIYNLDHDQAMNVFRQATVADPQDAGAYRGLASTLWLSITFRRGNMTVDDYLGGVGRPSSPPPPPPADTAAAFKAAIDRAIAISRARIEKNPKDTDAHYQLGAAVGLRASYTATVEGSAMGAFRAAREAYNEHEEVLVLDPRRKDAGLIVGTYRYIISAVSLPLRWMAYVVGFGGGKERGMRMIEDAVAYHGDNEEDARFALLLIYNRERRYDEALRELATLRERYPRNRLVWLESGATSLRAGRPADAERFLSDGLQRSAGDDRRRMFGEDALWHYKRGAARAALGRAAEAQADLRAALGDEARKWVHARTQLELGKLALAAHTPAAARDALQSAMTLAQGDNDAGTVEEARRLLNSIR